MNGQQRQTPDWLRNRRIRRPDFSGSVFGGRFRLLAPLIVVVIAAVAWLGTGVYVVGPGEEGVVRQFGAEVARTGPGIQFHLPWPVQQVDIVNIEEIRRVEVGFRCSRPGDRDVPCQDIPTEALMLTGDENIVDIHVVVQYKIKNASDYLFQLRQPDEALKTATEVALRGVVGRNTIDHTMIEARAEVEADVKGFLQQLMDSYDSGILVTEVKLQEVDAPEQVRDAFHDVVRAREDKDKLIREAQGYREDLVPKARGEKEQIVKAADAYAQQRVIRARGDADKFIQVLAEYEKAPDVTRKRLYLETIEKILPKVEKTIIDSAALKSILPFLPIGGRSALEAPATGG
jgi:membrane protease subunit HflK